MVLKNEGLEAEVGLQVDCNPSWSGRWEKKSKLESRVNKQVMWGRIRVEKRPNMQEKLEEVLSKAGSLTGWE